MRKILLLSALLPLLGGCASLATDRLPVCDGQARRPANPQGSTLLPAMQPDPADDPRDDPRGDPGESSERPTADATGGCA